MHWSLVQWKTSLAPLQLGFCCECVLPPADLGFFFAHFLHYMQGALYTHTKSACATILYFDSLQQFIFSQGFCIKYVHISFLPGSAIFSVVLIALYIPFILYCLYCFFHWYIPFNMSVNCLCKILCCKLTCFTSTHYSTR